MVIALETYCPAKDGVSAARIEEEVVVTANGPQVITRFPSAGAVRRQRVLETEARHDRACRRIATTGLRLYRIMVECRQFEVRAQELFFEGLVRGTTHLGIGQEAVAAGFAAAMREGRLHVLHVPRPQPHAGPRRADGADLRRAVRARHGSDGRQGRLDAPHVGRARGDGLVRDRRARTCRSRSAPPGPPSTAKSGQVAVCFFGDGTTNIGAFHEALNMAAVWKAPVVFVCENNQYMEYTADRGRDGGGAAGRGSCRGLRARADRGRRQRRGGRVRGRAADHRTGTGRRGAVARRGASRTATAATRGRTPASTGPTTRSRRGWREDPIPRLPGPARRGRRRRGRARRDRRGRGRGRRRRRGRGPGRARAVGRTCSRPRSGPTEARVAEAAHGGADVPRRRSPPGSPRRCGATRAWCSSGRTSAPPAASSRRPRGCSTSSVPSASATRRSASRRSSAPRWAPR